MGERTAIAWTDHTFNPWWGCERVSPGCQNCYAEAFAKRTGHDVWGKNAGRRFFGDKHWAEPLKWNAAAEAAGEPALVFCSSMADVFEDRPELVPHRERLWELIEATPHLIWQLLTKRPWNARVLTRFRYFHGLPDNVWIGTTVEDQQRADERIPHLLDIPARVRFLSCEPLLGPVELPWGNLCCDCESHSGVDDDEGPDKLWRCDSCDELIRYVDDPAGRITLDDLVARTRRRVSVQVLRAGRRIDWVIVGGESGPRHRPLDLEHARSIVEQCDDADVPVFFKQVGGRTPTAGGDLLDGQLIKQFPAYIRRSTR